MKDAAFRLVVGLFQPTPPFIPMHARRPGLWTVRDADGAAVAEAKTRAGARAAVRHLHSLRRAS